MKRLVFLLLFIIATIDLLGPSVFAQASGTDKYTYLRITPPGVYAGVWGINDKLQLVGYYGPDPDDPARRYTRAFIYTSGQFTFIQYPGGRPTNAMGINNRGELVGDYMLPSPVPGCGDQFSSRGFIWRSGTFIDLEFPGSCNTLARAINDRGQVVGITRLRGASIYVGFLFENGAFQQLPLPTPTAYFVDPRGINNNGLIVGYYYGSGIGGSGSGSFTYKDGVYTPVVLPVDTDYTWVFGVNDQGTLAGNRNRVPDQGFTLRDGSITLLEFPESLGTQAVGVSNSGVVAGRSWVNDPNSGQMTFGFLAFPRKGIIR